MNKVFLGLILTVCVLGMALVMLNDRLGRKAEPRQPAQASTPISDAEMAMNARAMELAEAAKALAPPSEEIRHEPRPTPSELPAPKPQLTTPEESVTEIAPPKVTPSKPEQTGQRPAPAKPEPPKAVTAKPEPSLPKPAPVKTEPVAAKPEPQRTEAHVSPPVKAEENKGASGKTANRFVIYARDKGATVRVGGNGKMDYSSMTLENPDRIVVDIAGDWKFPPNPGIPKNDLVNAVRVGQNGDKTRLVIDLKTKPRKVVLVPFKGGDGVDVRVDK